MLFAILGTVALAGLATLVIAAAQEPERKPVRIRTDDRRPRR